MNFTTDPSQFFHALRELNLHKADPKLRSVFSNGVPNLESTEYDNWNGGTQYYTLTIQVPVPDYAQFESELESIENAILSQIRRIQRNETHDFISQVVIQPFPSEYVPPESINSRFWIPGHFRLFISHLSKDKISAGRLKTALLQYGISGFVAHEDIEPAKEWQVEIENALFSMDAITAIYSVGFGESEWTDQEVGVGIGRRVLVIPLRHGIDPYGLAGKYQGLQTSDQKVSDVAKGVFEVLMQHERTSNRMIGCLVELFLLSTNGTDAMSRLSLLEEAGSITTEHLARISQNASNLPAELLTPEIVVRLNNLLIKHGADPIKIRQDSAHPFDDELPF